VTSIATTRDWSDGFIRSDHVYQVFEKCIKCKQLLQNTIEFKLQISSSQYLTLMQFRNM